MKSTFHEVSRSKPLPQFWETFYLIYNAYLWCRYCFIWIYVWGLIIFITLPDHHLYDIPSWWDSLLIYICFSFFQYQLVTTNGGSCIHPFNVYSSHRSTWFLQKRGHFCHGDIWERSVSGHWVKQEFICSLGVDRDVWKPNTSGRPSLQLVNIWEYNHLGLPKLVIKYDGRSPSTDKCRVAACELWVRTCILHAIMNH